MIDRVLTARSHGLRLWVRSSGPASGPTVVLAMGAGASSVWWPDELIGELIAAGFHVVRFDSRDTGLSDSATTPYVLDDLVDDLTAVLDAVDVASAHLIGVSMGGMLAQRLALRAPQRVASLTLIATSCEPASTRLGGRRPDVVEVAARPRTSLAEYRELELELRRRLSGPAFAFDADAVAATIDADIARGVDLECRHARAVFTAPPWTAELERLRVPTAIMHGTHDPVFALAHAQAIASAVEHSTLHVWSGAGHELPPSKSGAIVAALIGHASATDGYGRRSDDAGAQPQMGADDATPPA